MQVVATIWIARVSLELDTGLSGVLTLARKTRGAPSSAFHRPRIALLCSLVALDLLDGAAFAPFDHTTLSFQPYVDHEQAIVHRNGRITDQTLPLWFDNHGRR